MFARVGGEEFETEVGGGFFECKDAGFGVGGGVGVGRRAGEGGEVADERFEVLVVGVGFEAEAVLERDGEGADEVQRGQFGEQVGLAVLAFSLLGVHPDEPGQVPGGLDELGPVFAAFDVALVGARGAEGDAQTDDETEHGEQEIGYHERVPELAYTCDDGGPDGDEEQGDDHSRRDAAFHPEEIGPFTVVLFDVDGLGGEFSQGAGDTTVLRP